MFRSQSGEVPAWGNPHTFEVVASGTKPITYKWYRGDDLVQGGTQSALRLSELKEQDAGDYHVVVSNQTGTEASDAATLFVVVPPAITQLTDQVSVVEGDTLKLTVTAVGADQYQWYYDKNKDGIIQLAVRDKFGKLIEPGELIEFAITSVLTIAKVKPSDAGEYALEVINSAGAGLVKITVIVNQPARIVTQPKEGSAVLGESFTFEVVASGDAPIIYEWYHDGALKNDSTGSSLILSELAVTDSGDYHVVVSNEIMAKSGDLVQFGIETSDTVTFEVLLPPTITGLTKLKEGSAPDLSATAEVTGDEEEPTIYTWSQDGVLLQGDNVELTVTVTGTEPISYQWYHGEELVEGGTESTLRLTDVQGEDSGDYHVMVSNQLETVFSEVITLSVVPPPVVTELAGSINVVEGEGVELTVTAVGNAPLTYQWSKGEEMIDGATAPTLDLGNVKVSSKADYKLAISNAEGLAGSVVITVGLADPPVIVTQPVGGSANLDEAFTFQVVAEGFGPMEYEWHHDGAVVDEATESFLQLTNVQAEDAGDYHVVVTNIAGEVTSDTVTLELVLPPEITQLTKLKEGPAVDLSATAEVTGEEAEPTTYTWSEEGALLEGGNVELTVTLTGTEPISYQWYHGEELVEDGTESTLRLTDVQGVDSGDYYVMVSNQLGTEFSEVITLSVVPPPVVTELTGSINVVEGEEGIWS